MAKNVPIFLILIFVSAASWLRYADTPSSDLLATWMAGKYFSEGVFGQIYSADTNIFTMRPPSDWLQYLRANGFEDAIYPFIYPPIWAWFGSVLYGHSSFEKFVSVASIVNPLLLGGMIWLAVRMFADKYSEQVLFLVTGALFTTSLVALVALEQNQPQILVAFLMVLAVERTRAGSPVVGGIAMAFAASLKLYPAIFAIFWLAQGERRAVAVFTLVGAAIGLLSIALTGWQLHILYLEQLRAISSSVLVTLFTYSLDPTIAQIFFADQMRTVVSSNVLEPGELAAGWSIMKKPLVWRLADAALMLAVIAFLFRTARGPGGRDPLFWPLAFTLVALVSPLSWGYHYIAGLAFAGGLLERLPQRHAVFVLFAVFFPISVFFALVEIPGISWNHAIQPLCTLALAVFALVNWLAIRKPAQTNHAPLRPARYCL